MAEKKNTPQPETTRVVKVPPQNTDQDRGAPKVQILPELPQNTPTGNTTPTPTAPPETPLAACPSQLVP